MKAILSATLAAILLTGCASHSHTTSSTTALQTRGETLWTLVDAEWSHMGDRIKDGEDVPPSRVYQLAQIRYTLRGGQTLACMADIDAESRAAAKEMVDWSEKAIAAYIAGKPYPAFKREAMR